MILRRIILFFGTIFFWLPVNCQEWCGVTYPSENDRKNQIELFKKKEFAKKARKGTTYDIYVKPKIIHSSQNLTTISSDQVLEIINKLNLVFSETNIKFIVENNHIEHITDNEFYDLKTENDANFRSKYDSDDAINLYFTHTITRPDLSLLNGYTSLPNFSKRSNAIILAYLENDTSSFSILKDKITPHEFGHYFGLLHTYQDSNNEDITKRELVTRGIGANCNVTGDELCDTPADPFERIPSLISLDCSENTPADLVDFNGENYTPPRDNYMSYHHKCELRFTPMQFQRMESGLNIRLSSFAEYRITKNLSNFLSITNLNKKIYCKGENIVVNFQKTGLFETKNEFRVEISDKNGNNFREITEFEILDDKQLKITLDQSWENGNNYRLIITSTLPYTESPVSEDFEIKSLPSAEITSSQKSIQKGEELQLNLKFGGSGPWSFKDWDGFVYHKINSETINFSFLTDSSKLFYISEISNECGTIIQSPSVYVEVLQPNLQIQGTDSFCSEVLIDLPISGHKANAESGYYQIQIKNGSQIFNILPKTNSNSLEFPLPKDIQKNKTFNMKVVGKNATDFSNVFSFIVKDLPLPPKVITPINICPGAQDFFLKAEGENLKWYEEENSNEFTFSKLPNTKSPNKKAYYVSQSDSNQCESKKSKIEVIVEEPASAEISGNSSIYLKDSAFINISLKGSAPWVVTLDPIGEFKIDSSEAKLTVRPHISTEYKLTKVSNPCGPGTPKGEVRIIVLSILSTSETDAYALKVFPNPIINQTLNYEVKDDEISELIIYSSDGKLLKTYELNNNISKGEIILPTLSFGKYNLKFTGSKKTYSFTIVRR